MLAQVAALNGRERRIANPEVLDREISKMQRNAIQQWEKRIEMTRTASEQATLDTKHALDNAVRETMEDANQEHTTECVFCFTTKLYS